MSIEIAKYTFTPWIRKGISANITSKDNLGSGTSADTERAKIPVDVTVNTASPIKKEFSLIGPADIIGINSNMIIRTEPRNWITDFEPNYLAFIEFYDEDFAWRYTPAAADGDKLRPWVFLLVLKETEFERSSKKLPLPSITVKTSDGFPPNNQIWAWAHAHTNNDFQPGELNDLEEFLRSLNEKFEENPDNLYCRIMNPRNLEPNTSYYAFLVPSFETGRLAGLEKSTSGIDAQKPSWKNDSTDLEFPVYYEWYFKTGKDMDFEYLVRQLEPRIIDSKVGKRDMDCTNPGFGIETGTKPSILGLEGALKSPKAVSTTFPVVPRESKDFQKELEDIVNLPYRLLQQNNTEDPVISAPIYGDKHALIQELDISKDGWVHGLNSDPRYRVPSGFGTNVIQKNQDKFMQKAWKQVMKVIEANKIIMYTRMALAVSNSLSTKIFQKLDQITLLAVAKPALAKVLGSKTTLAHQLQNSLINSTVLSSSFRKISRPRGRLVRKLNTNQEKPFTISGLVQEANKGNISAAFPKKPPEKMVTTTTLSGNIVKISLPKFIKWTIKNYVIIFIILIVLFALLALITGNYKILGGIASILLVLLAVFSRFLSKLKNKIEASDILEDDKAAAALINKTPARPQFELKVSDPDDGSITSAADNKSAVGTDSKEAARFREAAVNLSQRLQIKKEEAVLPTFNIDNAYTKLQNALNPKISFPKQLAAKVKFPLDISYLLPENIIPAMAYPDFEEPMYEKLRDISTELLIPNLDLIPNNTISLLVTNQKFIEAYMVGLNHEMGRELLWREYPTDQRGSYFRQFWDVKGIVGIKDESTDDATLTEKYKDIKPIHTWHSKSILGSHNNRDAEGDMTQIVLVIKGELFRHYPDTIVFAQKAHGDTQSGDPKVKLELTDEEIKKELRFPLYKAEILPDIKFYGFDLTVEEATGTKKTNGFTDKEGWFFIIQEAPGEPRFGMDIEIGSNAGADTWDNLSWEHFSSALTYIDITKKPNFTPTDDISGGRWGASSAHMAYALYQKPVMIAVHAKEMLEGL
jgi:hypothetical protein